MTETPSTKSPAASLLDEPANTPKATATGSDEPTTDSPDTITELFARYPDVTDADLDRVIAHYRKLRAQLGADGKPQAKPKKAAAPRKNMTGVSGADLLKELGLDL